MLPGERLGPYEVVAKLGEGGMGDVYSARDTRLGRTVAIKRTHERFSDRFEREARAISALNHPNICQLYDVGPNFLVMELVDGAPIAAVDTSRKLLDLAVQMADGLAAAHTAGIVHRDLKPENILVTRDGRVKILDFGLATERSKLLGGEDAETVAAATEPGVILGTVSYMSPEQARGQSTVGPQSDQFSLGLVLYELVAGKRAFRRNSTAETLAAIIRDDPDPLPETTPAPLRWVIDRLLAKDPSERYDSTRDLHRELRQIRDRLSEATHISGVVAAPAAPLERPLPRAGVRTGVAVLAGIVLGGAAVALWYASRSAPATTAPDMANYTFTAIAADPRREWNGRWAPDGKSILHVAEVDDNARTFQVFTRTIGALESVQVTRVAGTAGTPFWSPDGSLIYFRSGGGLWAVASTGGTPERIFERAGNAVAHPDGQTLLFSLGRKFWIGRRGETPREHPAGELTTAPESNVTSLVPLAFSPNGEALAYRVGSQLWVMPYPNGTPRRLPVSDAIEASWMPDSRRLVVCRTPAVDHSMLSIVDSITGDERVFYAVPEGLSGGQVSPDGTGVLYTSQRSLGDVLEIGVADGRVRTMIAPRVRASRPAWAPDGKRYLFGSDRGIETAAAGDPISRPIVATDTPQSLSVPQWSPDGTQFTLVRTGSQGFQLMIANASGRMLPLDPKAPGATAAAVWTRDGQVIYERMTADQGTQVARIRPGSTAPTEIIATYPRGDARGRTPLAMSPDGNWILARSITAPGLFLVAPDFSRERALPFGRMSFGPGGFSLNHGSIGFSKDGREVMSVKRNTSADGARWQLWAVDIATGRERLVAGVDVPDSADQVLGFSLHPDGTRFLTSATSSPADIWLLSGFDKR